MVVYMCIYEEEEEREEESTVGLGEGAVCVKEGVRPIS